MSCVTTPIRCSHSHKRDRQVAGGARAKTNGILFAEPSLIPRAPITQSVYPPPRVRVGVNAVVVAPVVRVTGRPRDDAAREPPVLRVGPKGPVHPDLPDLPGWNPGWDVDDHADHYEAEIARYYRLSRDLYDAMVGSGDPAMARAAEEAVHEAFPEMHAHH